MVLWKNNQLIEIIPAWRIAGTKAISRINLPLLLDVRLDYEPAEVTVHGWIIYFSSEFIDRRGDQVLLSDLYDDNFKLN
jgi:hypothetical protein